MNPGKHAKRPLPEPVRYYGYDASLPAPYFRRFQERTRRLRDKTKRAHVERIIARLTTHADRRGDHRYNETQRDAWRPNNSSVSGRRRSETT